MATKKSKPTVVSKAVEKKSSTTKQPAPVRARAAPRSAPRRGDDAVLPAASLIEDRLREIGGWRGETLVRPVKLLSGGNPQIPKSHGDAPVQAYIDAMPGWKRDVGRRLDALITRTVPNVRKAVKWNSPLYGSVGGRGAGRGEDAVGDHWFLSLHCFAKYIKLAFFRGTELKPPPPVGSKVEGTRYFHIHEDDDLDEARLAAWIKQASRLPGVKM